MTLGSRFGLLIFWMFLAAAGPAMADDAPWTVPLTRPDSLIGWTYGSAPIQGWEIKDGRLRGTGQSTPLLSGYSFGDFELRFAWSAAPDGEVELSFPKVPLGKGVSLSFLEGNAGCLLSVGGVKLNRSKVVVPTSGAMHEAVVRRAGEMFSVTVDGREIGQTKVPAAERFGLGLAASGKEVVVANLRVLEPQGQPIFNGTDLTGWWTPGDIHGWGVENGCIVRTKGDGNFLRTNRDWGNFTLFLEYRISKGGNSGIAIRTPHAGWPSTDGMEMQILDEPLGMPVTEHSEMSIYRNVPSILRADKREQWNRVVVKADGRMISAWVNGQLVQQANTQDHPELKHRHLKGFIGIQDHGAKIEVRGLTVLEAPNGLGLDAWQTPAPRTTIGALVDRLMNPERLSVQDEPLQGATPGAVVVPASAGQAVATLVGPGILTRVTSESDRGQLSLYFDDESTPRLHGKTAELWKWLPLGIEGVKPALTCLPYQRNLKIIATGVPSGTYRFDHLALPKGANVASFSTLDALAPRGWPGAAIYRCQQFGWGVHRESDPLPRVQTAPKHVAAGKSETMARLDGAGIVHWMKLVANKNVLENNDLWLEVTLDGQSRPAVAAPVRFWFPGHAKQGNYPNFIVTDHAGLTNLLAMPYSGGITFSLRNQGRRTVKNLAVEVSYEEAAESTREAIARRMRLRGVFEPVGSKGPDLVSRQGRGRWIGLVYEQREEVPLSLDTLLVDGKPVEGWPAASLDSFVGGHGEFRGPSSGRSHGLFWRFLLVDPVDFQSSLLLKADRAPLGDRLTLFYESP